MKTHLFRRLACFGILLAPWAGQAQVDTPAKGYVLAKKGALPAVGVTVTTEIELDLKNAEMEVVVRGQSGKGRFAHGVRGKIVTEGLAPGKARRNLVDIAVGEAYVFNGKKTTQPDKGDPLEKVPVIVEYKGDAWTATLEKGRPSPEQAKALKEVEEMVVEDSGIAIYGEAPRKPGERWNVDPTTLEIYAGAYKPTGTITVEFVKVEELRGIPCAVLKTSFDIQGKPRPEAGEKGLRKASKGEIVIHRSLADLIDLQVRKDFNSLGRGTNSEGAEVKIEGQQKESFITTVEKR